jgi:nudix-type nucleoside diphosphatase (YffH/AdpP family)
MRLAGSVPEGTLRRRYPQMLTRAGARLRAGQAGPAGLRRSAAPDDVSETRFRQPYADYFAVEEFDVRFRRFDGRMSEELTRAVFISGDAAVVLPYDPRRDRVLVIEQWRAGAHARGDREPWLIEAVAGRIDGGETPEEAARREAREEAGLEVGALLAAGDYYPSPAAKGEYIYSFVGLADLPDDAAGLGGLPGEGEDIRAHVIPFARLMELVATGEVNNAPLVILAYWLDRNRAALRDRAGDASGA